MFIGALFTIAKLWKQSKCLLADEWIRRCGIYTYINIHIHIHIYIYIHIHIHTHTYIYTHTYTYTHIHVYIYTHTYTHTHTMLYCCGMCCAQSCLTLCNPMDCSLPACSVLGIFQVRIPKWLATSYSRDLPKPGMETASLLSPSLAGIFFTNALPGKPQWNISQPQKEWNFSFCHDMNGPQGYQATLVAQW